MGEFSRTVRGFFMVEHVRELRVHQQACEAARTICRLSKHWPKEERFSLTDQVRRSSRPVCANIAEAWHRRHYQKHFISKLSDVDAEAAETQDGLGYALDCEHVTRENCEALDPEHEHVIGGLAEVMRSLNDWCGPSDLVREDALYLSDE
jgi:four helix bundle protein